MDELKEFQIRVYGKQELAMLYLPTTHRWQPRMR